MLEHVFNMTSSLRTMKKHISFPVLVKSEQWKTIHLVLADNHTRSFFATAI